MEHGTLLVGQGQECLTDLLEPDPAFLLRRGGCLGQCSGVLQVAAFRAVAAALIDEGVVQDREQPATQVPPARNEPRRS